MLQTGMREAGYKKLFGLLPLKTDIEDDLYCASQNTVTTNSFQCPFRVLLGSL